MPERFPPLFAAALIVMFGTTATAAVAAPPADPTCGSAVASLNPQTPDERTLVGYFTAVNDKDYFAAWRILGGGMQSEYGSEQAFADLMAQHVGCVRVLDVEPVADGEYRVGFAAQYVTPFPAGSGALPGFWTVSGGRIVSSGTGP